MGAFGHSFEFASEPTELVTKSLTPELLWNDLRHFVTIAEKCGHASAEVMFGFAWGLEAGDEGWRDLTVQVSSIAARVEKAEREWEGRLGYDDLYVTVPAAQVRVRYCNDMDIHLSFTAPSSVTKLVLNFWLQNSWILPSDLERVKSLVEYEEPS